MLIFEKCRHNDHVAVIKSSDYLLSTLLNRLSRQQMMVILFFESVNMVQWIGMLALLIFSSQISQL